MDPAVQQWLRELPKPAGVFVPQDLWGVQAAEACRLLAETDVPLTQLARQAGYLDFHQLAAVFRRKMGATPTAYRRQMREQAKPVNHHSPNGAESHTPGHRPRCHTQISAGPHPPRSPSI